MTAKTRIPAMDGWLAVDDEPALIGTRCETCGTYFFPREDSFCRNPECSGTELTEVRLSRRGTVWSWTVNHYPAPAPYVSSDPFEPYAVVAVELPQERMVVLGQLAAGTEVRIGDEVEVVTDTLYEDDEHEYLVWKWKPVRA